MQISINSIKIRSDRQRKDLGDLAPLKASLLAVGTLINPIVVEPDPDAEHSYILIAGERRLTSWRQILDENPEALPECIPATLFSDLDESARQLIELEENLKRKDLTWQENVLATIKLAELKGFTDEAFAEYLGISNSVMSRIRSVWSMRDNEKVWGADNISNAYTIFKRESARQFSTVKADLNFLVSDFLNEGEKDENPKDSAGETFDGESGNNSVQNAQAPAISASSSISNSPYVSSRLSATKAEHPTSESNYRISQGDFKSWATSYSGRKFNLIHLDFPYGINHDKSKQGNTESYGTYEDTEDLYKSLVGTLLENQDKLIEESAHCICWLSLRYAEWTRKAFEVAGWDCHLQPFIWHKSDNRGIIADTLCGMRNVCEYALFFNRARRPVIKNISNVYSGPTTKRFHASEKSLPMLEYLFSALCDENSRVLDPTCGSGTAIMAAAKAGAASALGLELDEDFAEKAQEWLRQELLQIDSENDLFKNIL